MLTGLYSRPPAVVLLGGADITGLPPHKIAELGMARTFQNIRLFGLMTAEENVKVAMHSHLKSGVVRHRPATPRQRREEREAHDEALELLDFVGIGKTADEYARNLSYGDQRRLEVARALALSQGAAAGRADRRHEPARVGGVRRLRPPGTRREGSRCC